MLKVYKKGQGRIVRWSSFVALLLMVLFGCVTVYSIPPTDSWWYQIEFQARIFAQDIIIRRMIFICLPVFIVGATAVFWFLNRAKVVDFLIETEGELRKVSWPQRKEWVNSTAAVLIVIVFVTLFLMVVIYLVGTGLQRLGIGI